jgi:hypothetical protein
VAGNKAKQTVRDRCKQIGADRLVTLTYRENLTDRELALKQWKEFTRRLRKVHAFNYVAGMENQRWERYTSTSLCMAVKTTSSCVLFGSAY